jgi:hypothetical protein
VNRRVLLKLYKDNELSAFINAQARRHFSRIEDQQDVSAEVWEKLAELDRLPCEVRLFVYRVIHNSYERARRIRFKKCT